jgi:hypothetical protein
MTRMKERRLKRKNEYMNDNAKKEKGRMLCKRRQDNESQARGKPDRRMK